jgi:hypothetical protein
VLTVVQRCSRLTSLDLSGNYKLFEGANIATVLGCSRTLKHLILHRIVLASSIRDDLSPIGWHVGQICKRVDGLTILDLSNNDFCDHDVIMEALKNGLKRARTHFCQLVMKQCTINNAPITTLQVEGLQGTLPELEIIQ